MLYIRNHLNLNLILFFLMLIMIFNFTNLEIINKPVYANPFAIPVFTSIWQYVCVALAGAGLVSMNYEMSQSDLSNLQNDYLDKLPLDKQTKVLARFAELQGQEVIHITQSLLDELYIGYLYLAGVEYLKSNVPTNFDSSFYTNYAPQFPFVREFIVGNNLIRIQSNDMNFIGFSHNSGDSYSIRGRFLTDNYPDGSVTGQVNVFHYKIGVPSVYSSKTGLWVYNLLNFNLSATLYLNNSTYSPAIDPGIHDYDEPETVPMENDIDIKVPAIPSNPDTNIKIDIPWVTAPNIDSPKVNVPTRPTTADPDVEIPPLELPTNPLSGDLGSILDYIGSLIASLLAALLAFLLGLSTNLLSTLASIGSAITGAITSVISAISTFSLADLITALKDMLISLVVPYDGFFTDMFTGFRDNLSGRLGYDANELDVIKNLGSSNIDDIYANVQHAGNVKIVDFRNTWWKYKDYFQGIISAIIGLFLLIYNYDQIYYMIRGSHFVGSMFKGSKKD